MCIIPYSFLINIENWLENAIMSLVITQSLYTKINQTDFFVIRDTDLDNVFLSETA